MCQVFFALCGVRVLDSTAVVTWHATCSTSLAFGSKEAVHVVKIPLKTFSCWLSGSAAGLQLMEKAFSVVPLLACLLKLQLWHATLALRISSSETSSRFDFAAHSLPLMWGWQMQGYNSCVLSKREQYPSKTCLSQSRQASLRFSLPVWPHADTGGKYPVYKIWSQGRKPLSTILCSMRRDELWSQHFQRWGERWIT